jgi:pyruvate kinase
MNTTRRKIHQLIDELDGLFEHAGRLEKKFAPLLGRVHEENRESAVNLVHYLALRQHDRRDLQRSLGKIGVSRLGRAEGNVLWSVVAVRNILSRLVDEEEKALTRRLLPVGASARKIKSNTGRLLGKKRKGSRARIMVTLPSEAATDHRMVRSMLRAGMNCARINCAHDDVDAWGAMVENLARARHATGRTCRVCMDLAGPKIRTGAMTEGPRVMRIVPVRDLFGRPVVPAEVLLAAPGAIRPEEQAAALPLEASVVARLAIGQSLHFTDTRGKRCRFDVVRRDGRHFVARSSDSAWLATGTRIKVRTAEGVVDAVVGELPPIELKINLREGDRLVLHRDPRPGEPETVGADGRVVAPAHISCTSEAVFRDVKAGEPILLDDGAIAGVVSRVASGEIEVRITRAKEEGSKLRADKGINLPETALSLGGLTDKDRQDLRFAARHADVVSLSFVNRASDVDLLLRELRKLEATGMGVIIKVETQSCLRHLPEILLAAMRTHPVGVMIARGDLAIECGWENLAEIQEEILWLCEAAHLPIIWATQVLETLAKKGIPSRAEVTDAGVAERAECVMLNKGPHIVETIEMLGEILSSMEGYRDKRAPMLPALRHLGMEG